MKLHNRVFRYLFYAWLIIILVISSIPGLPNPNLELGNTLIRTDYIIHWAEYAILIGLFMLWRSWDTDRLSIRMGLFALFLGFIIATIDETHQLLIPGRRFNPYDLMFNFFGVITGIAMAFFFIFKFKKERMAPASSHQPKA